MIDPWKLENIRKSFEVGSPLAQGAALHKLQEMANEIAKLREENERLREALDECEDYFDNRADADCDQDGFIPNKEMQLLTTVRAALKEPTP